MKEEENEVKLELDDKTVLIILKYAIRYNNPMERIALERAIYYIEKYGVF